MKHSSVPSPKAHVDIVMIDDDGLTLEAARRRLRNSDCSLLTLPDGETLAEVLSTHPIKTLIVDYHLTRGTGLDLVRSLNEHGIDLPENIVLATASRPNQDISSSALALGMRVMLKSELINTETLEALAV